ncbi:MAG: HypC/HybG/HupF family hydrogenase formation chaperone [Acidilobaceae archaeon]|nr:HypC/HybG/HupF family hydrogenase formation chaperone [Acidilobaceae archaeon]MCX8166070.1 HypC/HybG/HupF family hydrogenase formation chaperone [Acidilobaceae archaeon]MDW7974713.1 HypC/HybG/HupF family hydrogenase formation chaperone [Sulfolobales archaeon]
MCWGVPAIVTKVINEITAEVDFGDGMPKRVVLGISAADIEPGAAVLVHAGVIVSRLSYEQIEDVIRYIEELAAIAGEAPPEDLIRRLRSLFQEVKR